MDNGYFKLFWRTGNPVFYSSAKAEEEKKKEASEKDAPPDAEG